MKKLLVFGLLLIALFGCTQEEAAPEQPMQTHPVETSETEQEAELNYPIKGVAISPRTFTEDDFLYFYEEEAKEVGEMVIWVGDWQELVDEGAPLDIYQLDEQFGYVPLIEVTYYDQGEGKLRRPFTEEKKREYKESTIDFAEEYLPPYFGMGVETNMMWYKSPEDYDEFVDFYNEMYDEIKKVSPDTKVFTVFQLERMKGCIFWVDDPCNESDAQWHLIGDFKSDVVAFTTYPNIFYKDPSEIPEDHYTEILEHTSKPVIFTEMGWHVEEYPPGWEGSEDKQKRFVERFFELSEDVEPEIIIWSFLYDNEDIEPRPFDTMGLKREDRSKRPAFNEWIKGGE